LVAPERNISLNSRKCSRNIAIRDGGRRQRGPGQPPGGATKIAKKPVSNSRLSHWKLVNVLPTTVTDR